MNKLEQNIERMGVGVINTGKSKTSENYNDMYKNVVLENKVTNDNNDIENGNVIEKVVSESDTLKIDSEIVSERERIIAVSYTHLDLYKRQYTYILYYILHINFIYALPLITCVPGVRNLLWFHLILDFFQ